MWAKLIVIFFIVLGIWILKVGIEPLLEVNHNYKSYTVEGEYAFEYSGTSLIEYSVHRRNRSGTRSSKSRKVQYYYPHYSGEVRGDEYGYSVPKKFSEGEAESFGASNPTWDVTAYLSNKGKIYILGSGVSLQKHFSTKIIECGYAILLGVGFALIGILEFDEAFDIGRKKKKHKNGKDKYDDKDDDKKYKNRRRKRRIGFQGAFGNIVNIILFGGLFLYLGTKFAPELTEPIIDFIMSFIPTSN